VEQLGSRVASARTAVYSFSFSFINGLSPAGCSSWMASTAGDVLPAADDGLRWQVGANIFKTPTISVLVGGDVDATATTTPEMPEIAPTRSSSLASTLDDLRPSLQRDCGGFIISC